MRLSASYPGKPDALKSVSLDIAKGEIMGLVGQSGCGKSTLSLAIMRLLHLKNGKLRGEIELNGRDILRLNERQMRALRGKEIALVLQSPMSSLNPALRIGTQMEEAWRVHRQSSGPQCREEVLQALADVALPADPDFLRRRPSQLSVGQAQRVLIAMAILHRPGLLIADEPTSALDIITQAEILDLFATLSAKFGMSVLYISHDLLSVATISNRVAVMHQGEIVECRSTAEIFRDPQHEYTRKLIRALPVVPNFEARAASK
ncbi:MAG TPA: ABC transporter ATP-binding protein [Terriglobales bacterium]|nr:ABC transporter ATP-binding protein [Terriglobales bacterium]